MRHEPTSGYEDPNLNYLVTWKLFEDEGGEAHEQVFTSRDQGWDFYQDKLKSRRSYGATWAHIPAGD